MTAKKGKKKRTIKKAHISKPAFDQERVAGSSVSAGFVMPQTEKENNILCQRADLLATMEEEKVDEGQRERYIRAVDSTCSWQHIVSNRLRNND